MQLRAMLMMVALAACGSEPAAPEKPAAPAAPDKPAAAPEAKPAPASLDADTLKKEAKQVALVPSPAEMQRSLAHAGLTTKLADLVGDRDVKMDTDNKDQLAVRTGVVLADVVLTVKTAPKEQLVARLQRLKEGFAKLEAGTDIGATIDDVVTRLNNDAVNRDDLLKEMDELSGVMVPELQFEAGDWVVPLIQAGSWLEGAYYVSGAIEAEKKADAAATLLKQPAVVDYFLKYVQHEGRDKAPDEVVAQLEETLKTLKEVTGKSQLTAEDVSTIHSATGALLTML